ncbi:hypothetical protein P7C70_g1978, partial [Phenoliferia sp. Uapishka_3]
MAYITGIAHINLTVLPNTLDAAAEFWSDTLGFTEVPVPELQRGTLKWFDITPGGQQIHLAYDYPTSSTLSQPSRRHPCFKVGSPELLRQLQEKVWAHHQKGVASSPKTCDQPGEENSGAKGKEYAQRFFCADWSGNRIEISL